ncbi:MAG: ferrous iron transport protein B [Chitinophagales bacterium]
MSEKQQIFLVGKPNVGKSSLFNQLTGLNQKVGNFSGVTVQFKLGEYKDNQVIDLPGLKSLHTHSPEEVISRDKLITNKENASIIFVANGNQLQSDLLFFSEIADLQMPMILLINFKDEMEQNRIEVDLKKLQTSLCCPVVLANAKTGDGLPELEEKIETQAFAIPTSFCKSMFDNFENNVYRNDYIAHIRHEHGEDFSDEDYYQRKRIVKNIADKVIVNHAENDFLNKTKKWDKILLHPIYGLLIFLAVLYVVFQAVFTLSSFPMDWIDMGMSALSSWASDAIGIPWLRELVADAILPGIGGVVIFIPQIAILFFLLGILEHSGYLARISYISDNFLKKFGLSGKSVVPMMSSWACAIPAIMSARMIEDPKERMAVIFATPLMTCSARLPVYSILIAIVFPTNSLWQGLALLALYLLGLVATLVVAWFVNKRSKIEANPFWSLELPTYRMPNWKSIFINVYQKTKSFVFQAGKIILAISIVLWILSTNSPKSEDFVAQQYESHLTDNTQSHYLTKEAFQLEYSYMGYMGKAIEPVIKPLGYDWKIGIALISSFAAREVFVGTLSTIYSIGAEDDASIIERLKMEKNTTTGEARFTMATAVSLLLFYVFAMQCMSTLAVVKKETGTWKYAIYQFFLMTGIAYVFALVSYQVLA